MGSRSKYDFKDVVTTPLTTLQSRNLQGTLITPLITAHEVKVIIRGRFTNLCISLFLLKALMNSDVPRETAATFFLANLYLKQGIYWLGVCHKFIS